MLLCYKQNYVKTQLDDDIMIQEMVLRFVFKCFWNMNLRFIVYLFSSTCTLILRMISLLTWILPEVAIGGVL